MCIEGKTYQGWIGLIPTRPRQARGLGNKESAVATGAFLLSVFAILRWPFQGIKKKRLKTPPFLN